MQMWDAIFTRVQAVSPLLIALLGGGAFFKFLLAMINRHDGIVEQQRQAELTLADQAQIWQMAFRHSDSWTRGITTLILTAAICFRDGDKEMGLKLLSAFCEEHLDRNSDGKGWHMKPFPNFLEIATKEFEALRRSPVKHNPRPPATMETKDE